MYTRPKKVSAPQGAMKYEIIRISSFGKVGMPASFIKNGGIAVSILLF